MSLDDSSISYNSLLGDEVKNIQYLLHIVTGFQFTFYFIFFNIFIDKNLRRLNFEYKNIRRESSGFYIYILLTLLTSRLLKSEPSIVWKI